MSVYDDEQFQVLQMMTHVVKMFASEANLCL